MAGIQITGLASGLNWQNLITEIIQADSAPETQWKSQQTTNQTEISSLSTLQSDLTSLQTAADALTTGTTFTARTATVSNSNSGWSATANAGTDTGQYTFDVSQLATTSVLTGAGNVGSGISSSSNVSGVTIGTMNVATPITAGVFTVDGAQVQISTSDSLQDVFNNIASATNNAVTASYDPTTDTIKLSSSSPITLGAQNDSSNFLTVTNLYTNGKDSVSSPSALGSVSLTSTIANSGLKQPITDVDSSGNGSFSVNGVAINFNVNTDTLGSILDDINNSGAGVTATFNSATSQFVLTNNSTGNTGISINENSGGLLGAMGLTTSGGGQFTDGQNAVFTINGSSQFISKSNNLDASVAGVSGLTVNATSTGSQTITVGNDTSGVGAAINNLVSAYNTVQAYITSQTQITTNSDGTVSTNPLSEDQDVINMQSSLQNMMFNSVSGLTGISSLDQIGIGFTGTSPLLTVQDQTALNNAIQNNPDQVAQLFTSYPNGLVAQIDSFVNNATSSSGSIASETNALNQNDANLTSQVNNLQTQLTAEQQQLTQEFTAMETAESQYQSELSTLNSILNTGSSSSSSSSSSNNSLSTEQSAFANASSSTSSSSSA